MREPPQPNLALQAKLGCIIVHLLHHAESGNKFEVDTARYLMAEPDVQAWLRQMAPLLPRNKWP